MLSRPTTLANTNPQLQDVVTSLDSLLQRQVSSGVSHGFMFLVMLLLLATVVSVCQDAILLALDSEHPAVLSTVYTCTCGP
jgi:hypothetical protein